MNTRQQAPNGESQAKVGDLLHRITDDVKTIAKNEVELARIEIENTAKSAAADAAVILLGGIVALIGLGLLCVVVVVALAPVIPQLWLRLLIMAVVYLALGGTVAGVFAKKLQKDIKPNLDLPAREAQQTVAAIKDGLSA
ncbi:MAG: hypothetical protein JWP01_1983 [Myxococcales bacterium]|nr:hypothetical protein [Myxococcales bacterium]